MEDALNLIPTLRIALLKFQVTGEDEDLARISNIMYDIQSDAWQHWLNLALVRILSAEGIADDGARGSGPVDKQNTV